MSLVAVCQAPLRTRDSSFLLALPPSHRPVSGRQQPAAHRLVVHLEVAAGQMLGQQRRPEVGVTLVGHQFQHRGAHGVGFCAADGSGLAAGTPAPRRPGCGTAARPTGSAGNPAPAARWLAAGSVPSVGPRHHRPSFPFPLAHVECLRSGDGCYPNRAQQGTVSWSRTSLAATMSFRPASSSRYFAGVRAAQLKGASHGAKSQGPSSKLKAGADSPDFLSPAGRAMERECRALLNRSPHPASPGYFGRIIIAPVTGLAASPRRRTRRSALRRPTAAR